MNGTFSYIRAFSFFVLLSSLSITHASEDKVEKNEDYYQTIAAKQIEGKTEVVLDDGTRCDIVTKTHAIEVDFSKKWYEAIGQSLNYAFQTNLKAGIILIVQEEDDQRYLLRKRPRVDLL